MSSVCPSTPARPRKNSFPEKKRAGRAHEEAPVGMEAPRIRGDS